MILTGIILAAVAAFALLAYNLTGGIDLQAGELLRRSAYPAPGTYTMTAEATGALSVTIESQNQQETMMHTSTILYEGDISGAAFTVPEDSLVVYFNFAAGQDLRLESGPVRQPERHPASGVLLRRHEALPPQSGSRAGHGRV